MITPEEAKILQVVVDKQVIQASDLKRVMPGKIPASISRSLRQLREKKMTIPEAEHSRKYILRFDNNYLLRGVVKKLSDNDFLPLE